MNIRTFNLHNIILYIYSYFDVAMCEPEVKLSRLSYLDPVTVAILHSLIIFNNAQSKPLFSTGFVLFSVPYGAKFREKTSEICCLWINVGSKMPLKFPALVYKNHLGAWKKSSSHLLLGLPIRSQVMALWIPYAVVSQILLDWRRLSARISARTRSVQTSTYDTYGVRGWMKDMEATDCSIGMVEW